MLNRHINDPEYTTITFQHSNGNVPPKLKEIIQTLLAEPKEGHAKVVAVQQGYFDPDYLKETWEAFSGRRHNMQQSRKSSFIEALFNVAIGYFVALASQLAIFPLFGINIPLSTNIAIGAWFTVISIIRSYVIRRWFNARLHRAALSLAGEK